MSDMDPFIQSITVEIDAPADFVWDVLTDVPRYPEWNPFTRKVVTDFAIGGAVRLTVPDSNGSDELFEFDEYLRTFEPPKLLAWGIPDYALREQIVTPLGPDRCAYHSTDRWFGDGVADYVNHGDYVQRGFDSVALALKARVEVLRATTG
ncbi:hypothetical protein ACFB49_08260 [Sphingomonas sp. DBB INV C78]|uniref:SRPBCC domain-containing protein n=1 Tax=Sphingomonas sp. DBB INV C78 TaxID=3349434 RepID=UPI0036D34F62